MVYALPKDGQIVSGDGGISVPTPQDMVIHQNSDKLISTGFKRLYTVDDAINEVFEKLLNGSIRPSEKSFTVKYMKKKGF